MAQAQAAGGGEGLSGLLQNPKVQIGVIVAGALALIGVAIMLFAGNGGGAAAPAVAPTPMAGGSETAPGMPSASAPSAPGAPGAGAPPAAMPGAAPAMPGAAPGMPGAAPAPGGAPAATAATASEQPSRQAPGVPTRKNPFSATSELRDVLKSIPPTVDYKVPEAISPTHDIYAELNPPEPPVSVSDDEGEGPPVPPMRVAGFVEGAQLSATIQLGSPPGARFEQVTPGKSITFRGQTYKVERLEQNKVILVNNWEMGNRTGTQRIEVTLSGGGPSS